VVRFLIGFKFALNDSKFVFVFSLVTAVARLRHMGQTFEI